MHTRTVGLLKTVARSRILLIFFTLATIALGVAVFSAFRASSTLVTAEQDLSTSRQVSLRKSNFQPTLVPGAKHLLPSTQWVAATRFQDSLWAASSAVLTEFDPQGNRKRTLRVGIELPPAPISALTVATLRDTPQPVLLIATLGQGVLLYDGRSITQLKPSTPERARVRSLAVSPSGELFLATDSGLLLYDTALSVPEPELAQVRITTLSHDRTSLWVGTADRGVYLLRGGRTRHFSKSEGLPDNQIEALAHHGKRTWVATPAGIAEFLDDQFRTTPHRDLAATSMSATPEGFVVATLDQGLWLERASKLRQVSRDPGITQVAVLAQQIVYTASSGIHLLDQGQPRSFTGKPAGDIDHRNIAALHAAPDGKLWIGYFDQGLEILAVDGTRELRLNDDRLFCINRIVPREGTGETWIATTNGVAVLVGSRVVRWLTRRDGLLADHASDIAFSGKSAYIATSAGLSILDTADTTGFNVMHGLPSNHVYSVLPVANRIVTGTLGGLALLDNTRIALAFTTSNSSLPANWIAALARSDSDLFLGTYGGSIARLDARDVLHRFDDLPRDLVINLNAAVATPQAVYFGTLDRGLYRYTRSAQRWEQMTQGLPSLNVTALAHASGRLFVGTDNGIVTLPE